MAIERAQYNIGLCPSPGKRLAKEWTIPVVMESQVIGEDQLQITIYLMPEGRIAPDRIYTLELCPEGQVCACFYEAPLSWQADSACNALFSWSWPIDGGCMMKKGQLTGSKSGLISTEQVSGDPGNPIYPVGDPRNPICPGCGMSGASRQSQWNVPVPGEYFGLIGCFDEEACIAVYGEEGCRAIGGKYYEKTGFCGGEIKSVKDEDKRLYWVEVKGEQGLAYGTDRTEYQIGEWVALSKVSCTFPRDEENNLIPVTDSNVCKIEGQENPETGELEFDNYVIVPYGFRGI